MSSKLYNLNDEYSRQKFSARVRYLWEKRALVELTDASRRSLSQNNYLHLCLGLIASDTGNSLEVVKQYYKEQICPDIYVSFKDDERLGKVKVVKSSAKIGKDKMSESIDRLRVFASSIGIYLPSPEDEESIAQAVMEVSNHNNYQP